MRTSLVRAGRTGWRRGGRGGGGPRTARPPPRRGGRRRVPAARDSVERRAPADAQNWNGAAPRQGPAAPARLAATPGVAAPAPGAMVAVGGDGQGGRRRAGSRRRRPAAASVHVADVAVPVGAAGMSWPRPWMSPRAGPAAAAGGAPPAAATQRRPRDRLRATRCATVPRTGAGRAGLPTAPAARLAMNRPRRRWLAPI